MVTFLLFFILVVITIKFLFIMKTLKFFLSLVFSLLFLGNVFSAENFYFDADYSVFRSSSTKSILEVYFSFTQKGLFFVKTGNNFVGEANTQIIIFDNATSKEIFNETYGLQSKVVDSAQFKLKNKLIGQQNLTIPNGNYTLTFIGYDQNNQNRKDTIILELNLNQFEDTKSSLSSLQLASRIDKSSDSSSIFFKNGLELTPNPNLLFGSNLNKLYYYIEVYYPLVDFNSDSAQFSVLITDPSGKLLNEKRKSVNTKNTIYAETGYFNVDSLMTGSYFITAALIDNVTDKKVSREKKFFIYNNAPKKQDYTSPDEEAFMQSEFILLTESQVEDEFNKLIYFRNSSDNKEWDNLKTLEDKRKFLFKFWKKRDTNLNTPRVESRDEFFNRIKEANKQFKENFKDGWKSDRGRIYVMYGAPSEVDRHFMEADVKNYEIWTYDFFEGGTICVFAEVQTSGEGTYLLVHSTMRNEFKDPDWYAKLKK